MDAELVAAVMTNPGFELRNATAEFARQQAKCRCDGSIETLTLGVNHGGKAWFTEERQW
jgi:hypothetical protein